MRLKEWYDDDDYREPIEQDVEINLAYHDIPDNLYAGAVLAQRHSEHTALVLVELDPPQFDGRVKYSYALHVASVRGSIYDRDGEALFGDVSSYSSVYVSKKDASDALRGKKTLWEIS